MTKFAIAIAAAAILAAPSLSSSAEAGGCGGYGGGGYGSYSSRPSYQSYSAPKRAHKPKIRFAAKNKPAAIKASVQAKNTSTDVAPIVSEHNASVDQNSVAETSAVPSTKVVEVAPVATKKPVKSASASSNAASNTVRVCRRYSAAVGGLVEVSCE